MHLQTSHVEQNCHVLVNLACQLIKLKENLNIGNKLNICRNYKLLLSILCIKALLLRYRKEEMSMFGWGVLKRGVPESVWFCTGDLPMYTTFGTYLSLVYMALTLIAHEI